MAVAQTSDVRSDVVPLCSKVKLRTSVDLPNFACRIKGQGNNVACTEVEYYCFILCDGRGNGTIGNLNGLSQIRG